MNGLLNYRMVQPYRRNLRPTSVQRIYQNIDSKDLHDPNDRHPNDRHPNDRNRPSGPTDYNIRNYNIRNTNGGLK